MKKIGWKCHIPPPVEPIHTYTIEMTESERVRVLEAIKAGMAFYGGGHHSFGLACGLVDILEGR